MRAVAPCSGAKQRAQGALDGAGSLHRRLPFGQEALAAGRQVNAGGATLTLQGVDELTDDIGQFDAPSEVPNGIELQLLGTQDEVGDRQGHGHSKRVGV